MALTLNDLTVKFDHLQEDELLEHWRWLIGNCYRPILISAVGDMFLQHTNGAVFWLLTGSAEFEEVAETHAEFTEKLGDVEIVKDWFLAQVLGDIFECGGNLRQGQVFSFKRLPVLGGEYSWENYAASDIEEHFAITGQINAQIRDLPDGTTVQFGIAE